MIRFLQIAVYILLTLVTPALQAATGNLLLNPGFESDPMGETYTILGWNPYGGNAHSETGAAQAHSGTNYFKVFQAYNGQINYTGVYQDYISGGGAAYVANGWAFMLSNNQVAGENIAWLEVTFRDAGANVLGLYRSALIDTNTIATGAFPANTWTNLAVTNQYNPSNYTITNTVTQLVAPPGTCFVRYQIVFQGDAAGSGGSVLFDDLYLAQTSGPAYGNWNIIWSDEFTESTVNTNIWTNDLANGGSNPGWGNNELEYYTSSTNNAFISNGCLHIVALQQSTNGFSYTSARLKTEGLFSCQCGRIEWRAQLPAGIGVWPALWLLGTNIASTNIGWPGCGEIDVMENNGSNTTTVQASLHSGSDETGYFNFIGATNTTTFHTYTVDWATNGFLFYVDGHLYEIQTGWNSSTTNAYPYPFDQPFFLLMNLAIGGNYVGNPAISNINAGTSFPAVMLVDYVRLYNQTAPLQLSIAATTPGVALTWPSNIICHLQTQTNVLGIGTNWINLTTTTNSYSVNTNTAAAYYRLASP